MTEVNEFKEDSSLTVTSLETPVLNMFHLVGNHRCGLGIISLPLTYWTRGRSPGGSISWLIFRSFSSNVRKFRPHSSSDIIWSSKLFIRLSTSTVSDLSGSTWSSLNKISINEPGPFDSRHRLKLVPPRCHCVVIV